MAGWGRRGFWQRATRSWTCHHESCRVSNSPRAADRANAGLRRPERRRLVGFWRRKGFYFSIVGRDARLFLGDTNRRTLSPGKASYAAKERERRLLGRNFGNGKTRAGAIVESR